ncbi:hypothetical protein MCAG_04146 [Micromonospora sp. ATCC 39149]|uniref:DUF202 domain-containing protein n=1 Tax=Micromonospora carbonacea TaxID=47853 RepID=A0A7D5Y9V3_9ACTN|nr:DUF202 domain-containing protein [Micromonospora sp. ATCC 39149]EEP73819.1 hypothetical protein MCAG_04146 [Micromonospora sp. ATCC 39149]QLJ99719.1 DUF202 domain-containing protein [Micromonospora carbonacea]
MTGDPGLQPERTRLAWRRSLLALTVVTVLSVRLALTGDAAGAVLAGAAVAGWAATLALCWGRAIGSGPVRATSRTMPAIALAAAGQAALGVLLILR